MKTKEETITNEHMMKLAGFSSEPTIPRNESPDKEALELMEAVEKIGTRENQKEFVVRDYPFLTNVLCYGKNMVVGYKTKIEALAAFRFITNFHHLIRSYDYNNSKEFVVTLFERKEKFEDVECIEEPKFMGKYNLIDTWEY